MYRVSWRPFQGGVPLLKLTTPPPQKKKIALLAQQVPPNHNESPLPPQKKKKNPPGNPDVLFYSYVWPWILKIIV